MAKFNDTTEEKVIQNINESFHWAEEWKSRNVDEELNKCLKLYMSQIDEDEGMWKWIRNRLFIPKTQSIIETILPKMFGFEPTFSVQPRESTDESKARIMEAVLKYYLYNMDFPIKLILWARNNAIYGFAPIKVVWKTKTRLVRRPLSEEERNTYLVADQSPPSMIDYPMTLFDGPDIMIVDPFDYFWTPTGYDLDDMPFQIHRSSKTYDYLRLLEKKDIYTNINKLEKATGSHAGTRVYEAAKRERDITLGVSQTDSVVPKSIDEFELYESQCYLPLIDKGDSLEWDDEADKIPVIATLAEMQTLVRLQRVPWYYRDHNYLVSNFVPLAGRFIGISAPAMIEGLQKALNFRHSIAIDNMDLNTNTMWVRRRAAMIKDFQLRSRPGGIIDTNDMQGIQPLPVNDMTGTNLNYAQMLDELIEDAMSISRLTKGVESGSELNRTATGILALQRAAEVKIKQRQLEFEWKALRKLGKFFIQLIQENCPPEMVIRITGEQEPITVTPEDLVGQFDVVPYLGIENEVDKQSKQDRLMMAYDRILKSPLAMKYNIGEMDRRILESLDIKDIDKIIPMELTMMTPEMAMQEQAAAMGIEAGGIPPGEEGMLPEEAGMPVSPMGGGGPPQGRAALKLVG